MPELSQDERKLLKAHRQTERERETTRQTQLDRQTATDRQIRHPPAASMKARLRRKVSRGSFRFRRKSLRRPVTAWTSSTLLSSGTLLPRRNFSFSSRMVRSAPDSRYRPVWTETDGGRVSLSHAVTGHGDDL